MTVVNRPGVLDRLGLFYPVLREANPRIVLCSLSGYGQTGPYANRPGHELNFLGLSGFFTVPGRIDGEITRPGVRVGDMAGAMQAAFALTVALAGAAATGQGQHIDVSLTESIAGWCALFALPLADGGDPLKSGLVQGDNDVFRTADGRLLSLATFEDKFWRELRSALGTKFPGLNTDAYDRRAARTAAKEKIHDLLTEVFAAHDHAWWERTLTGIGRTMGPRVHHTPTAHRRPTSDGKKPVFPGLRSGAAGALPGPLRVRPEHLPHAGTRTGRAHTGGARSDAHRPDHRGFRATASSASTEPDMTVRTCSVRCSVGQSHHARASRRSTSSSE